MSDKLPLRDEFVVNASPLITLFKSGLEFVLPNCSELSSCLVLCGRRCLTATMMPPRD